MPTITNPSAAVVDLADELTRQLSSSGNAAKASIGDRTAAFAWTGGSRPSPLSVFSSVLVEGLTYRTSVVSPSGTPAVKVAPGAPKPTAVTVASGTKTMPKYAGQATILTEAIIDSVGLIPAIESVIFDQVLRAFYIDVADEVDNAALATTGADWQSAILNGIGVLPDADILVISPQDLASVLSPASGYAVALADAIPVVFGLGLIALPGLAAGAAYVMKSSALVVFDTKLSPLVLCDPYSKSSTNEVVLVCDAWAAAQLVAPGAAVKVTVSP